MVTFNFTFQPGTSLQQMIGFEIAGRVWAAYLTDNVTVNLHVGITSLPLGVLGGALPGFKAGQPFDSLYGLLQADVTSVDDQAALPAYDKSKFSGAFDRYDRDKGTVKSNDIKFNDKGTAVTLTRANAKALGTPVSATSGNLDGYIVLNSEIKDSAGQSIPWSYNYASTTVPSNAVDFLSTAIHEIGHTLGFVSGVDRPWTVIPTADDKSAFMDIAPERLNAATMLDTFRTTASFNSKDKVTVNLSVGGARYFSVDSQSILGYFSTGQDTSLGGNGYQASHWRGDGANSGIMNATLGVGGQRVQFSSLDLRALDAIGWNLSSTGINTPLDWSTLQDQAKQSLASRLGQTIAWLSTNPTTAAQQLSQDRLIDVNAMLTDSSVYAGRLNTASRSWQELFSLISEQGLGERLESSAKPPRATRHSDVLVGSTGDDQISGLRGNDQLIGFTGNDILWGNRGHDLLRGNVGQDTLMGGNGNDTLMGGRGCDRLLGGKGNNVLIGGTGADIFVVQRQPGLDRVKDFVLGEDKLTLADGLRFEQLGIQQRQGNTLIDYKGEPLMRLENVAAHLITAANFS